VYTLRATPTFRRKLKRLIKTDAELRNRVRKTLELHATDPMSPSLRSHKVLDSTGTPSFSSFVTGDVRISWDYDRTTNETRIIDLLDVGGHSGSQKVYR
jgi:mRNA-degrading endonuclease YafQ of YafQ-DinJ toxin-antitoxin module